MGKAIDLIRFLESMDDYVYKNRDDTVRIRIFKHSNRSWDYDVFTKDGKVTTYSSEAGDLFFTKGEAKKDAEQQYGKLVSLGSVKTVTSGWLLTKGGKK